MCRSPLKKFSDDSATSKSSAPKSSEEWKAFRQDVLIAENYQFTHARGARFQAPNPFLEKFLPSLLYVDAVAILDQALVEWEGIQPMKAKKDTLHYRLELLGQSLLSTSRAGWAGLDVLPGWVARVGNLHGTPLS